MEYGSDSHNRSTLKLRLAEVCAMDKTSIRKVFRWIAKRFHTLDRLPEYFDAAAGQMQDILWGALLPFLAWGIWFIVSTPPTWINVTAIGSALFMAGYYVWRADHLRLEKKIEVTQVRRHTWDRGVKLGVQYYFEIVNKSEGMTIHQIRAQLKEMIPEIENISWLPIVLHQQHDNVTPYAQSFDLAPSEPKHLDLLTGIDGEKYFNVSHILGPSVRAVVQITGKHRLKVMITGEDIPILFVWFVVWMDEGGVLRCEMEPA
jgi:hypothetical protein